MKYSEVSKRLNEKLLEMNVQELLSFSNILVNIENLESFVDLLKEVSGYPKEIRDQVIESIYQRVKLEVYKK